MTTIFPPKYRSLHLPTAHTKPPLTSPLHLNLSSPRITITTLPYRIPVQKIGGNALSYVILLASTPIRDRGIFFIG